MKPAERKNVLSHLKVREAMRRLTVHLPHDASLEKAARFTIKYKVNALLVTGQDLEPVGVISKTDLMGAYYAEMPLETPVESVMMAPPLFCRMEDSLEAALESMRTHRVHRLFVLGDDSPEAVGVLANPDIVGLLYRYCHQCERSIIRSRSAGADKSFADRFTVAEVMTPSVQAHRRNESLTQVMEGLSAHRLGAVLISGEQGLPVGVLSKTDLIVAYKHGVPTTTRAEAIMHAPVTTCHQEAPLALAIHKMIFSDVYRLFVHRHDPKNIVGVLSLTDAARIRSGSCRACMSSRIEIESAL